MNAPALTERELGLINQVFRRPPELLDVRIFGARAKGTHTPRSDVDLAIWGDVDAIRAEAISAELDELPLPYHFDVKPFESIKLESLRDHIQRIGVPVYP